MTYLLDTNAASAVMAGEARTLAHLLSLPAGDDVAVASITRGELLHGVGRLPPSRRRAHLQREAGKLFDQVQDCLMGGHRTAAVRAPGADPVAAP